MAGNSASKPLNCTPNELPCMNSGELRGRSSMHSRDTQHLIFQIGISKYLYKTLLANLITYYYWQKMCFAKKFIYVLAVRYNYLADKLLYMQAT